MPTVMVFFTSSWRMLHSFQFVPNFCAIVITTDTLKIYLTVTIAGSTTQPSVQWVLEALTLQVKQLGHEADHSPMSSAVVKNAWSCT